MPEPSLTARRFGARLRYLRTLRNMTQAELADKVGLSLRQISRIEQGSSSPSFAVLEKIGQVLDVSMVSLFLFPDQDSPGRSPASQKIPFMEEDRPWVMDIRTPARIGVWSLEVGSGKTRWSASVFELLGYPPFSVKPTLKRFLKHVRPDQCDEARIFFEEAGQGRGRHILVQVDTKSLGPRTVSIHVDKGRVEKGLEEKNAMRPETGREMLLILQDVTDVTAMAGTLMQNQQELEEHVRVRNKDLALALDNYKRETEEKAKAEYHQRIWGLMVRNSQDAQAFVDHSGTIVVVNEAYEQLVGVSADELHGTCYADFLRQFWGDEFFEKEIRLHLDRALLRGAKAQREGWVDYGRGPRFVKRTYVPCRHGRDIVGVVVTIHDLTDIMTAQEQLRHAEAALRARIQELDCFFSISQDLLVIGQRNGSILRLSPAWEHLLGYPRSELEGYKYLRFIHPADKADSVAMFEKLATAKFARSTNRYRARDGRYRTIEWNLQVMGDFVYAVGRDVTARKQDEDTLQQRDLLLELAATTALKLLRSSNPDQCLPGILAQLGLRTNTDRVYIFKNHQDEPTGKLLSSQILEWSRSGVTPQIDNPMLQNVPLCDLAPRWVREMNAGNSIMGFVQDFSEQEKLILEAQKIQSLLVVPIQVDDRFWGFLGFDSVRTPRIWSAAEESVLRIVAAAIGAAIPRNIC
ncbi:PAS domain S-box-containing protein [Desulfonatronum zhilinae]|nr:PAS domain S-box-containing protein [Desulfonatronum zhilinae]